MDSWKHCRIFVFTEKKQAAQPEFWIAADQVVSPAQSGFYVKLEETLESFGFAAKVRALCAPAYDKSGVGRPGIDPVVSAAVRKFDRNRPGKGSNAQWKNPHDPDAKIGRTKDGATDMIYKPEAVVDLDTGAIVQAEVHPGDQADHKEMAARVLEAQQNINRACEQKLDTLTVQSVTSDKGYYAVTELQALQSEAIRTVIADPIDNRRLHKLEPNQKKAVAAARRSVRSKSGKDL